MFLRACPESSSALSRSRRAPRLAAAWILLAAACFGQQLVYEEFGFTQGLGNSAINGLLVDREGYLWVGTMSGLYRGDGERFVRFDESKGLPNATVQGLLQDSAGRLWVAARTGVAWKEDGRFRTAEFEQPVEIFGRRVLAMARGGGIYAATAQGLFLGTEERGGWRFRRVELPKPLAGAAINALHAEPEGALWLSALKRLWRLERGRIEEWGPARGVPASRWDDFIRDGEDGFWVRGADALIELPRGAARFEDRTGRLPASGFFGSLALDQGGRLIVPTDNGLFVREDGQWRCYGAAQGLPGQSVSATLHDQEGSLWLGLWGLGLVRVAGYSVTETWMTQDGLGSSTVSAVLVDAEGRAWAGTDNGLAVKAPGASRWTPLADTRGLCGSKIRTLALGPDGAVWAGCFPGGVSRVDPGTGRAQRFAGSGLPDRVNGMLVDELGHLWVASLEGLYRTSGPAAGRADLIRLQPPGAAAREVYFRMARGRNGAVWITSSEGLLLWRAGEWKRFGSRDGLHETALTHVAEDRTGAVWVAYRNPLGVTRLLMDENLAVQGIEHFHGRLSSPTALLLRTDAAGRVWIGGDNGLDIWDAGRWRRFSKADGLAAHSCAVDAFFPARDGSIWIGTSRGITRITRPVAATEPLRRSVPVALTWVRLGRQRVEHVEQAPLSIRGEDRSFTAGMAALTFRHRHGIRFEYRLSGNHDNWIEAESREARYTELPPGSYTLEVRAAAPRDDLSFAALQIPVVVHPPFWMTWWFRGIGLAAMAGAVRLAWRWRIRALQERQRWLEEAVRERTRQLRAEKERTAEALARAEQASRFKSDFLARMSHEIRTPMHGVIGTADLLSRSGLREDQEQLVRTLQQSAGILLNLLNDILDLSKVEAGKLVLASRPFNLARVVETVASLMRPTAESKGLELRTVLPPGPLVFAGDRHRVEQILLNLVSNAVKFTDSGFVEITVSVPGGSARGFELAVRDSGCGIDPQRLESIFLPFVQDDQGHQRPDTGTGLGLSIAKTLAEAMGGRIVAESQPGQGSVFRASLPLPSADAGGEAEIPVHEKPAAQELGRALRVLVVEDNALNQAMVARMLAVLGHQAEVAGDGLQAIERAMRDSFDVVLMDIRLPGVDGLEAARRLREGGFRAPILALSANVYESDRAAAEAAGMDGFLGKPLHLEELREALEQAAARGRSGGGSG